jgi:Predicted metal-dependent protease of the PAD1/JAB1 superfamily
MKLPKEFVDEMVAHAVADAPNECCGIIAGKDGSAIKLYRAKNSEASPYRYNIGSDLIHINRECNENDWSFFAIYHSHTASEAYPSPTDIRLAKLGDSQVAYPDTYYIIVSLKEKERPVVRAFLIELEAVIESPIEQTDG